MADEADNAATQTDRATEAAVAAARARVAAGPAAYECDECGDEINPKRREAVPGVRLCFECASDAEYRSRMR
ncbi:TraR/DksA C4-type zinc finger protein [Salinisphaera sp. SPP-AMP-43]|uniref:TraR/DksA C4-type zinc finger protein n=1 Tax=Salinisphaera sp. SPP-AMP-43 TaxID=3121288 RepID=UPI003C6DC12D